MYLITLHSQYLSYSFPHMLDRQLLGTWISLVTSDPELGISAQTEPLQVGWLNSNSLLARMEVPDLPQA
jgi:hypothetical protein